MDLDSYLLYGGLPQIVDSSCPQEDLDAYINTYLREEIMAEALVQNLVRFSAFLRTAALCNAQHINYANVAGDSGVPAGSLRAWFEILHDTFTGFLIEPWNGPKRKPTATSKFFFFDTDAANFLAGSHTLQRNSAEYRRLFEQFIAMELRAWLSYRRIK